MHTATARLRFHSRQPRLGRPLFVAGHRALKQTRSSSKGYVMMRRPLLSLLLVFSSLPALAQNERHFTVHYAFHGEECQPRKGARFLLSWFGSKTRGIQPRGRHEKRHTLGARVWGERGPWAYDAETMYQFGSFGVGIINAWRVAADNWYSFSSSAGVRASDWQPISRAGIRIQQTPISRHSIRCSRAAHTLDARSASD
jgi:alginate export protein